MYGDVSVRINFEAFSDYDVIYHDTSYTTYDMANPTTILSPLKRQSTISGVD